LKFKLQELLIPGSHIGESDDNCYVAIFKSGSNKGINEWLFGSPLFQQQYIVYDMTPSDERGQKYAYVGFAPKNPINNVLAAHYDKSSPDYHNYTED